jgi:hypothetical protein
VAVSAWMGHTVTKPHPANLSMTGYGGGLWGEIGPGSMWHDFMKAYYSNKRPLDWSRPADVISGLLCKLTGQPVPDSVPSDLTVKDIFVKALADQQQPVPCQDPNNPNPDASPSPGAGDGGPSPSPGDGGPLPSPTDILPTPIVLPSPHH